jgi:hypothetical protein
MANVVIFPVIFVVAKTKQIVEHFIRVISA